jgi:predicted MFS family arabinose efflux permease
MTIYMLAGPLATLISFVLGGWLNEHYGWRITFFIVGVPALLVAVLVKFTIAEPPRRTTHAAVPQPQLIRLTNVLSMLWHQRSARHLTLGIILFWTMGLGLMPWYAAFMMRTHAMGTAELGVWLGLIVGSGGGAGMLLGGYVAGRWFPNNERTQMRLSALMIASLVPCFALFLLLPRKYEALIAFIPLIMVFNCFFGPTFALLQRLVADDTRATTLAVVMLLANFIGMGIGPQMVGTLSDVLAPALGVDSLRYAMLIMSFTALWAAYHFWQVGNKVESDLRTVGRPFAPPILGA